MQPHRAEGVAAELEATRDDALAARETGDRATVDELHAEWQGRLRRLLVARPDAAAELRALLDELAPGGAAGSVVVLRARASGHGHIQQAGRDQHITER
ncbi:hypothetical protein [Streptomyces sp. B8F3]|uniref:hypothetical protein n=1 Tax=unclassified Streptomyces TaxID=2593676 RepID=UPI00325DC45A